MRTAAGALAILLLVGSARTAPAEAVVSESEALVSARELVTSVAGYTSRHPAAAGAFAPWVAGNVGAKAPLLVHSYPALEPIYYYVPLTSEGSGANSFVTLDATDASVHAYGRRPPGFPSVARDEAALAAGRCLDGSVDPEALIVVSLEDRNLYWHLPLCEAPREVFVSVTDAADILDAAPAVPTALLVDAPGEAAADTDHPREGARAERPDPDYPPAFDIPDVPHHYQITNYHCGPATVQMVMDYWGPEIDQQEVGEVADTQGSGTHLSDMLRAAQFSAISTAVQNPDLHGYAERRLGYGAVDCYWSQPNENDPDFLNRHHDLKSIVSSSYPVIIVMRFAPNLYGTHARVLKGYDDSTGVYILHDPWYSGVYQGPDLHFNQNVFDDLWSRAYRWGGFISPWEIEIDAPDEVLHGVPFTVTAHVTYPGPHPFNGYDETELPTVEPVSSDLFELAPGQEAVRSLYGWFADSGCHYDPVSWEFVADSLVQTGTVEFLARGLLHDSASSYTSYSDSIGGRCEIPLSVVDPDLVTVDAAGGGDFAVIQHALDFVTDGDSIELLPGTYSGPGNRDLSFHGRSVSLRGVEGPEVTIIDCEGAGRGFALSDGEGPDTVIEGITIRNGRAPVSGWAEAGGGIFLNDASPTIRDIILEENTSPGWAGGMCCLNGSSPLLDRVDFVRNTAEGGEGGGLWCSLDSRPRLERCVFFENEAASGGGAVACREGAAPELVNCTLALNAAPECGGVFCSASSPLLTDTIVYGSVEGCAIACRDGAAPVLASCLVYGNAGGDGLPTSCSASGTVFSDPHLCDPARGAFHLQECSPCIGAAASGGNVGAFGVRCACEQSEAVPGALFLHAASPSPFRASTTLRLSVPADAGRVSLAVYNVRGQLVRTLVDGRVVPGERQYIWRGDDASGNALGAGIYFARCECDAGTMSRKLVLLR